MIHGSLFSGIGGFDLAAEWMGWENKFHCEINEFCNKVLKYYWPNAQEYTDIKTSDFSIWRHRIDVLTGGFPCQPYSHAGKRKGSEDDRHLWPFMLAAIKSIQPRWVVGENVLGLVNWSGGLVFHEVQTDLEAAGYEVWPYVLPACAIDAPHRRDRVWFVAHSKCKRGNGHEHEIVADKRREYAQYDIGENGGKGTFTDTGHKRLQGSEDFGGIGKCGENGDEFTSRFFQPNWNQFPTQFPLCSRNDGLSDRLAGITFPKHRNESIKAYGNSVVPQVVYQIFKAIEQYEMLNSEPNPERSVATEDKSGV